MTKIRIELFVNNADEVHEVPEYSHIIFVISTLCSPKLGFPIQLRLLHDFDPEL